ncbi:unnamed protein product, partial [Polarella glacialis]
MRMMHDLKVWCPYHPEAKSSSAHRSAASSEAAIDERTNAKRARTGVPEMCDWEGSYTDLLAKHLQECPFHIVLCPQGCGQSIRRKDIQTHAPECPKNFEMCAICSEQVRFGEMAAHRSKKAELHVQLLEAKLAQQSPTLDHQAMLKELIQNETAKQVQLIQIT